MYKRTYSLSINSAAWMVACYDYLEGLKEKINLPGEESVKRFERSNGLDTALYKTIPFFKI